MNENKQKGSLPCTIKEANTVNHAPFVDPVDNRGFRAKVKEHLQERYKQVTVKRVMRILDAFPTVERFCSASWSERLQKYRGARPKVHIDLGKLCTKAINDVVAFVADTKRNEKLDKEAKERAEKEAAKAAEKAKVAAEEEEERRNPKFSLGELKALTAMMELCDISSIDLRKIKLFLASVNVKIKEQ